MVTGAWHAGMTGVFRCQVIASSLTGAMGPLILGFVWRGLRGALSGRPRLEGDFSCCELYQGIRRGLAIALGPAMPFPSMSRRSEAHKSPAKGLTAQVVAKIDGKYFAAGSFQEL